MAACPNCGAENREEARFCDACGTALAERAAPREVRKVVTVLFCDVTGSTALGERIDPESLRRVMARYFETAKAIVERHGGSVEKFIGDAVMAVFGVPAVHEDDALRAVRAADELRGSLADLNDELEGSYGTRLELRMGVNTGEVVTGTEERLATGDAVNVAARLEQAAQPGEVLVGQETFRLVRGVANTEPIQPIAAKGKTEPLLGHRLLSVRAGDAPRSGEAPMVGRERQLQLLEHAFASASAERSCHLFTILGSAGVGKSRLAEEFLRTLDDAVLVRGRCLSYGEGISYWPVTEVVKQLQPETPEGTPLAAILGEEAAASPDEIAWAFRKLLESRAADRPLVVVFDDVHWGAPAFLDLVEHVADLSRGAPILLLCMARPELLDTRPSWGGGKLNATNVLLEPLASGEAGELIDSLASEIPPQLRERILAAAEGNPLFVEEMVAMTSEDGVGEIVVPPTIQALLAARLDQLEPAERSVLERGAIEGLIFHRGGVAVLSPDEPAVDGRLVTLVRKDLLRPDQPLLAGDDAYRFRHQLIRDTAYDALPKAVRADLHERFAVWLEEHGAGLVELDEILGFHLEHAYRYRLELGPLDPHAMQIARSAGARLLAAGERAQARADFGAAGSLLRRAVDLIPEGEHDRLLAQVDLAVVEGHAGDFPRARSIVHEAESAANAAGDEVAALRAGLVKLDLRVQTDPRMGLATALEGSKAYGKRAEALGDDETLVRAELNIAKFTWWSGSTLEAARSFDRARELAARVKPALLPEIDTWAAFGLWSGPEPAQSALAKCDRLIAAGLGGPIREATVRMIRGTLRTLLGEAEEGLAEEREARALLQDVGHRIVAAGTSMMIGESELLAGNPAGAEKVLREGYTLLKEHGETGYFSSIAAVRSYALLMLGDEDEALEIADEVLEIAADDDFEPVARARAVRAMIFARRGLHEDAAAEIGPAVERVEKSDFLTVRTVIALAEADVAALAGRTDDEQAALRRAIGLAEQKGDRLTPSRVRERLA